jgi:SAM-dependent methyltransferase
MDLSQLSDGADSATSSSSFDDPIHKPQNQFRYLDGRRYLKDEIYPLPSDMAEMQRQNLCTLLTSRVLGAPTCVPIDPLNSPREVLELGCGGAYWSATCHDFFNCLDMPNPSFTGLDIVPMAPDLKEQGIDWTFVQHDVRRSRLPFEDERFDIVIVKEMNLTMQLRGQSWDRVLREIFRILRPGGHIEMQNMDLFIRTLSPNPHNPSYMTMYDESVAQNTGTYLVSAITSFGASQNQYFNDFNKWVEAAMERKDLNATPGTHVHATLVAETAVLEGFEYKRVAIPFAASLDWEFSHKRNHSGSQFKRRYTTVEQRSIRQTALQVIIQWIEALEPLLREVSGKNEEKWYRWWAAMMRNLTESQSCAAGECLEVGSWWARKK